MSSWDLCFKGKVSKAHQTFIVSPPLAAPMVTICPVSQDKIINPHPLVRRCLGFWVKPKDCPLCYYPLRNIFINYKYDIMRENTQMTLRNWKSQADNVEWCFAKISWLLMVIPPNYIYICWVFMLSQFEMTDALYLPSVDSQHKLYGTDPHLQLSKILTTVLKNIFYV